MQILVRKNSLDIQHTYSCELFICRSNPRISLSIYYEIMYCMYSFFKIFPVFKSVTLEINLLLGNKNMLHEGMCDQ